MKLSIVVVCYGMKRELPRTLTSLCRTYQRYSQALDYEVIVVDNGSSDPIGAAAVESIGPEFRYIYLQDPPPSPAFALNHGVSQTTGDVVGLIIDGATILSPGVFEKVRRCFSMLPHSVVAVRYFFLGPGEQNITVQQGYGPEAEDRLLENIGWPGNGYRLFDVATPLRFPGQKKSSWMDKIIESNCLWMSKAMFEEIGGCDERFTIPGGGFMNIDTFQRAANAVALRPDGELILLIGEGVFHQVHGGTTTNVEPRVRDNEVATYREEYRSIRGGDMEQTKTEFHYFGHLPLESAKIHRRTFSDN